MRHVRVIVTLTYHAASRPLSEVHPREAANVLSKVASVPRLDHRHVRIYLYGAINGTGTQ